MVRNWADAALFNANLQWEALLKHSFKQEPIKAEECDETDFFICRFMWQWFAFLQMFLFLLLLFNKDALHRFGFSIALSASAENFSTDV